MSVVRGLILTDSTEFKQRAGCGQRRGFITFEVKQLSVRRDRFHFNSSEVKQSS